jgi:predicted AAA+ superfamily ATPase
MFPRLLKIDRDSKHSIFLFGPRGTGKTYWLKQHFKNALYIDLLNSSVLTPLLAEPHRLESLIPPHFNDWIILDEVQKAPDILNEVHRLIEEKGYKFILTGSSARSLKRKGVNLLAGRALEYKMHPLTIQEVGKSFDLTHALQQGMLPAVYQVSDPEHYLSSYINTYLREEILQEGLARNLGQFTRFLETASFSQGSLINASEIAREASIDRKVVSSYFEILEDLLIAVRLPPFTKHAKRRLTAHDKFYLFDVGVYRSIRPTGPLDITQEMDGSALETLFLQHLRAINDYYRLGFNLYYWRTQHQVEVDFVAYGNKGLCAFEIKRKAKLASKDFNGLKAFHKDYPMAKLYLIYGGKQREYHGNIEVIPFVEALENLDSLLIPYRA